MKTNLKLPTKNSEVRDQLTDFTTLIFGPENVGKTPLALQWPEPILCAWEPGSKAYSCRQIPNIDKGERSLNWERFRNYIPLLCESDRQTIIQDTIDTAYDECMEWVCRRAGYEHPSDAEDYGKTWRAVEREFAGQMIRLINSGKTIVLVSHSQISEDEPGEDGEVSDRTIITTLPKQARRFFTRVADIVLYYYFTEQGRAIRVRGSNSVRAKCRIKNKFLTPSGKFINVIPMTFPEEETKPSERTFQRLVRAFNNQLEIRNGRIVRSK